MKVSRDGKKEEFSQVLAEWFKDVDYGQWTSRCDKCMQSHDASQLCKLMKSMLKDPHSYEMLLKFVRRYKVAVDKMTSADVQEAKNLIKIRKVMNS